MPALGIRFVRPPLGSLGAVWKSASNDALDIREAELDFGTCAKVEIVPKPIIFCHFRVSEPWIAVFHDARSDVEGKADLATR